MEKEQNPKAEEKMNNKTESSETLENNEKESEVKITPEDKIKESEVKITPEDKIKELEDKLVRALAEMENQRRRFEKEIDDAFEYGGFSFARESLNLIDNFDRAKQSLENDEKIKDTDVLKKTLEHLDIVKKDLISIFKRNNIEQIICKNKKFDPNFHQAMLEIDDTSKEPGTVVQEIQKGYTMKDRLLRPSLVGVTRFKNEDIKKDQENKDNHDTKK